MITQAIWIPGSLDISIRLSHRKRLGRFSPQKTYDLKKTTWLKSTCSGEKNNHHTKKSTSKKPTYQLFVLEQKHIMTSNHPPQPTNQPPNHQTFFWGIPHRSMHASWSSRCCSRRQSRTWRPQVIYKTSTCTPPPNGKTSATQDEIWPNDNTLRSGGHSWSYNLPAMNPLPTMKNEGFGHLKTQVILP